MKIKKKKTKKKIQFQEKEAFELREKLQKEKKGLYFIAPLLRHGYCVVKINRKTNSVKKIWESSGQMLSVHSIRREMPNSLIFKKETIIKYI